MLYQTTSDTIDKLFLNDFSQTDKQRIMNSMGVHNDEIFVSGWNLHRIKKSDRAFLVTDKKILMGSISNLFGIHNHIDLSDIVDVVFDGIFCFNIYTRSKQPSASSIPASYFFDKASYALLNIEQKTLLSYMARIIKIIVKYGKDNNQQMP